MKVYILMADGFEECEALVPADLLMRAGAEVVLTSITDRLEVRAHGIRVLCDKAVGGFSIDDAAMVVLPGGGEGTENLKASVRVQAILDAAVARGCTSAPSALRRAFWAKGPAGRQARDLLPAFAPALANAIKVEDKVVTDDIFITAEGMGVSFAFGLALITVLYGEAKAEEVRLSTRAG
ncbi:MAG: DJ-1/PfpI family protein [Acutalibacteraceae bacterium]